MWIRDETQVRTKYCYSLISEVRVLFEKRMLVTFLCLSKHLYLMDQNIFLHSNLAVMVMWLYNNYAWKIQCELLNATLVSSFQDNFKDIK